MYKIAKDKLPALYAALQNIGTLLLPCADKAGRVDFAQYHEGVQPALEAPLTSRSAKDVFFPQVENLLTFKTSGKELPWSRIFRLPAQRLLWACVPAMRAALKF